LPPAIPLLPRTHCPPPSRSCRQGRRRYDRSGHCHLDHYTRCWCSLQNNARTPRCYRNAYERRVAEVVGGAQACVCFRYVDARKRDLESVVMMTFRVSHCSDRDWLRAAASAVLVNERPLARQDGSWNFPGKADHSSSLAPRQTQTLFTHTSLASSSSLLPQSAASPSAMSTCQPLCGRAPP